MFKGVKLSNLFLIHFVSFFFLVGVTNIIIKLIMLWNRDRKDRNGSSNIYKIAYNAIHKRERPSYLCRETKKITNHTH